MRRPHQRQQVAAIIGGVIQRIEAADQEGGDAECVIVQQRFRDLLRGANQRGGIGPGTDRRRDLGPQALVPDLAARGGFQQAHGANAFGFRIEPANAVAAQVANALDDSVGPLPGGFLGGGQHGAHGQAEADTVRLPPGPHASGPHTGDRVPRLIQGFPPERIDIRVFGGEFDGDVRRATEIDRNMRLLQRLDPRERVFHLIIGALVVERRVSGPGPTQQPDILVGPAVAFLVVQEVAVASLLDAIATGDDVDAASPTGEHVECGEQTSRVGGRDEAGAVGDHKAQGLGVLGGMGCHQHRIGVGGVVGDQHPVEAGSLMRLGEARDVVRIDDRSLGWVDLGLCLGRDHADEFDGHGGLLPHSSPVYGEAQVGSMVGVGCVRDRGNVR